MALKSILFAGTSGAEQNLYTAVLQGVAQLEFSPSGGDALSRFERSLQPGVEPFGLIITEVQAGPMRGLELLERISSYEPLPARLMLGVSTIPEEFHREVRQRGGLGLMEKPVNLTDLRGIIQELLQGKHSSRLNAYFQLKGWEYDELF